MSANEKVLISRVHVLETIGHLRAAGNRGTEGVGLWAGNRDGRVGIVKEVIVPEHEAAEDRFWIPELAMRALQARLRESGLVLLSQVHSHPYEAFHSGADDE